MVRVLLLLLVGFTTTRRGMITRTRKEKPMAVTRIKERKLGKHYCGAELAKDILTEIAVVIVFIAAAARKTVEWHDWSWESKGEDDQ